MRRFTMTVRSFGTDEHYEGCMFGNDRVAVHRTGVQELIFYPSIEEMKVSIRGKDVNGSSRVTFIDE